MVSQHTCPVGSENNGQPTHLSCWPVFQKGGDSSDGIASGRKARCSTDAGSESAVQQGFFSQSQLPVQTPWWHWYIPFVQSHATTYGCGVGCVCVCVCVWGVHPLCSVTCKNIWVWCGGRVCVCVCVCVVYIPFVQSHAKTYACMLKIPHTVGSHAIIWTYKNTAHTDRNGQHCSCSCCALPR